MNQVHMSILLWSHWRKSRWLLGAAVLYLVAASVILFVIDHYGLRTKSGRPDEDMILALMFLSTMALIPISTVLLIHSESNRISISMPERVLCLPVATWKMVASQMGFGAGAVASVGLAAGAVVSGVLVIPFSWWLPAAVSVCVMAAIQSWALAFGDANPRAAIVTFALMVASILWFFRQEWAYNFFYEGNIIVVGGAMLAFCLLAYAIALTGVTVNRRGGLPKVFATVSEGSKSSKRPFRSPKHAQRWYEWRLFGWQLPVAVVGVSIAYFIVMPLLVAMFRVTDVTGHSRAEGFQTFFRIDWLTSAQFVITGLEIGVVLGAVVVGGLMFMRAGHWNSESIYLLTRPMTTRQIASARLSVMFRSALLTVCCLGGIVGAGILWLNSRGEYMGLASFLVQGFAGIEPWMAMIFFWGAMVVLMWVAVWSVNIGWMLLVLGAAFGGATLIVQGLNIASPLADAEMATRALTIWKWSTWLAAGVLLAMFFWAAWRALSLKLTSVRMALLAVVLYLIYGAAFLVYGLTYELATGGYLAEHPFPHPINWPLWVGLSIVPIAPIFTHALLFNFARRD